MITLAERVRSRATTGFDYLRVGLSIGVFLWHSIYISYGAGLDREIWLSAWRPLPGALLPMFFALSGFLVAGSLDRVSVPAFLSLRVLRIFPALGVDILLSAMLLGPLLTVDRDYFQRPEFARYFLNILGIIHFHLPGVFLSNPDAATVNRQLWTIPYELECYIALTVLAVVGVVRRRALMVVLLGAFVLMFTVYAVVAKPLPIGSVPGRAMVAAFLAGVALYAFRDKVPHSRVLAIACLCAGLALLEFTDLSFLAVLPLAYLTVWLGLFQLPSLAMGDLSYGIYLFSYPIQQTVCQFTPAPWRAWWLNILVAAPPTLLFAAASWFLIEKPLLARRHALVTFVDEAFGRLGKPDRRASQAPPLQDRPL